MALFGKQVKTAEGGHKGMSLGELQAAVEGTTLLNKAGMRHFQQTFMKLATSMQNPKIKASVARPTPRHAFVCSLPILTASHRRNRPC